MTIMVTDASRLQPWCSQISAKMWYFVSVKIDRTLIDLNTWNWPLYLFVTNDRLWIESVVGNEN